MIETAMNTTGMTDDEIVALGEFGDRCNSGAFVVALEQLGLYPGQCHIERNKDNQIIRFVLDVD